MIDKLIKISYRYIHRLIFSTKFKIDRKRIKNKTSELVNNLRTKNRIKVLFIINCLPKWKTENLYLSLSSLSKFDTVIGVGLMTTDYPQEALNKYSILVNYLNKKGYSYIDLKDYNDLISINPDVIFIQEASGGGLPNSLTYSKYINCIYCYIPYAFITIKEKELLNTPYHNICWKVFCQNEIEASYLKTVMSNRGKNLVVTGLPLADTLMKGKEEFNDPWKNSHKNKKRIIWAPHHSISTNETINFGTFLLYYDTMRNLSIKYKDEIQWAFKPHPALRGKLYYLWGKEKTDAYYSFWENSEHTQLEEGDYVALFKHSDALIHDCASFICEYLYTQKPGLYLMSDGEHNFNPFGELCFDQYYKCFNSKDIENFIINVLNDDDKLVENRNQIFKQYLMPPKGESSSQNIIDVILNGK